MRKQASRLYYVKYMAFPFGAMLPILAMFTDTIYRGIAFNFNTIIHLHKVNPLHWIIDTTPIVLGFTFYFLISKEEKRDNKLQNWTDVRLKSEKKLLKFIEDINRGDYNTDIKKSEEANDKNFIDALLNLRKKLSVEREKEKIRNWMNEGLANFSEILRSGKETQIMYDNLISNIVKYINGNQGGLYVIDENKNEEQVIKLVSCYAYNRKKYEEKEIKIGQGLLGQTYLEAQTLVLKSIPHDYVTITSGMGEATPNNLLIIPLKVNESVEALLEVASFNELEPFHVEFLEKLGEGIASTISAIKADQKTKGLLEKLQIQTGEMSTQEEDMRQNMEELQATQEEMVRKESEYIDRIGNLENSFIGE